MDSLEPYQEMYHLGGGDFVPLFEEELCETNQQVVPIKQEIETPGYPEPPKMLMEPSDVPMEEILPVPLDNLKVEIPEEIDEDSPKPIVRAPIHRRKPAPVLRTKAYRAELGADAYGLNRFDRLLAKMPKSKAGRKKKFATTNMSRNALAARENRDKKKEYVEELEDGVRCLNGLFKKVLDELEETDRTCTSLKEAVNYYVRLIAELKLNAFQREG